MVRKYATSRVVRERNSLHFINRVIKIQISTSPTQMAEAIARNLEKKKNPVEQ